MSIKKVKTPAKMFTSDIGKLEDRIENLELVTSLSLLELNTKTLQIQDAQSQHALTALITFSFSIIKS